MISQTDTTCELQTQCINKRTWTIAHVYSVNFKTYYSLSRFWNKINVLIGIAMDDH